MPRRLACAVIVVALGAAIGQASGEQALERDVKATFLYNFTRFVEWPPELPPGAEPFRLCVAADSEMALSIGRTVAGESVKGRPLVMIEPQTPEEARACQILYVGRTETARAARLLSAVRDLPVLTVGDSPEFAERGGVIEFVLREKNVRFEVNLSSAQRSKLKLSANLLRVADRVLGAPR